MIFCKFKYGRTMSIIMKNNIHPLHIITTKKTIINQVEEFAYDIDCGLAYCIINNDKNNDEYNRVLYSVSWRMHMIARFVYKGKMGICKLSENGYRKILFEYFAESIEEVADIIKRMGIEATDENARLVYNCLRSMEGLISHSIANTNETIYINELANMIDYVIKKKGNVPESEYEYGSSLFPSNYDYEEFKYWKEFFKYEV